MDIEFFVLILFFSFLALIAIISVGVLMYKFNSHLDRMNEIEESYQRELTKRWMSEE